MLGFASVCDRRDFMARLGISSAGLCLGFDLFGAEKTNEPDGDDDAKPKTSSPEQEALSKGLNPNVFIHIAETGLVTIVCHRSEMGQGIRSSLPVLMADELGADMKSVNIVQAEGDKKYGDQNTDGSNSIRGIYEDMRRAAATARTMLIQAAASRLSVDAETCIAEGHAVKHKASGKTLGFGELALAAAKLPVPMPTDVKLRPTAELRRVGKDLPLLDAPAYVTGKAVFGADIKLPGMLVAVIARPTVVGARVTKVDGTRALAVRGVRKVVELPAPKAPYVFQPWGGVAVLADDTWAAIQGRKALGITWELGDNASYDSTTFKETLLASVRKSGEPVRRVGDAAKSLQSAVKTLDAEYYVPHLPHAPMEPPVALAKYDPANGGSCEVWAPTQNPQAARTEVARVLGLSEDKVAVHVTMLGGGFGRKSKADMVSEAAWLSRAVSAPVRVQFTREDDIHNDYVNTVSAQKLTAAMDANGKIVAWRHRTAFPPIGSTFDPSVKRPGSGDLQQGVFDLALGGVPNVLVEACEATAHVRIGWLRSVYNIFHAFAVSSFLDEIAHAQGRDTKDVLLEIHGPAKNLSLKDLGIKDLKNYGASLDKHPVNVGRLRGVIERVTKNAQWANRKSIKGKALGLAAHRSFLSYVGVVASVTRGPSKEIAVDEVWIVIDAGLVVNTDRVRAQMEGSVISAMNHALYGGVTYKAGAVEQSNFDGVQLVRMNSAPRKIHVDIIRSDAAPGGVGEPGVPPVAPAIANAIFALTGTRHRAMPFV